MAVGRPGWLDSVWALPVRRGDDRLLLFLLWWWDVGALGQRGRGNVEGWQLVGAGILLDEQRRVGCCPVTALGSSGHVAVECRFC